MNSSEEKIKRTFEQLKNSLDPLLYTNPAFKKVFMDACRNSIGMTGKDSYNVVISENGKMIRVFDEGINVVCCDNLRNNRFFNATTIYLEGNSLYVDFDSGTTYRADDYREMSIPVKLEYSSVLRTFYSHSVYDENGIEMSRSWFSDNYELTDEYDKVDLKSQVLTELHKPKYSIELIPKKPLCCKDADAGCLYRTYDALGMAYEKRAYAIDFYGNASIVKNKLFEINPDNPHVLDILSLPIATWQNEEGEFLFHQYQNKSEIEVQNIVMEKFKNGMEVSFRENYPAMYLVMTTILNSHKSK